MTICIASVAPMEKDISGSSREVKRAKLFEIQRQARRIRQGRKKGTETRLKKNQRKIERSETCERKERRNNNQRR